MYYFYIIVHTLYIYLRSFPSYEWANDILRKYFKTLYKTENNYYKHVFMQQKTYINRYSCCSAVKNVTKERSGGWYLWELGLYFTAIFILYLFDLINQVWWETKKYQMRNIQKSCRNKQKKSQWICGGVEDWLDSMNAYCCRFYQGWISI